MQNKQVNSSVGEGLGDLAESGALFLAGNLDFFPTLILLMRKQTWKQKSQGGRGLSGLESGRRVRPRAGSSVGAQPGLRVQEEMPGSR